MASKKNQSSFWEENKVNIVGWVVVILIVLGGFAAANFYSSSQQQKLNDVLSINETDQVIGSETAPNVLIEYSDFECPFCAQYAPIIDELKTNYADQVRVVYRHFPLQNSHANAEAAHVASLAAANQDKFWEMHDLLFANQAEWSREEDPQEIFTEYATELELDLDAFAADLEDSTLLDEVLAVKRTGVGIGISATPTFFLNGEQLSLEEIAYNTDNIVAKFNQTSSVSTVGEEEVLSSSASSAAEE